ncbi:hypothetical protein [Streptomyces caelestis]|uniref:hypothetical protein n=1 Tax=Streptomyces caelestis TaxID=36816 RepID=UPI003653DB3A
MFRRSTGAGPEAWTLLTPCQALRTVMAGAAASTPTTPDHYSPTTLFQAARDRVVQAAAVEVADCGAAGLLGTQA